MEPQRKFLEFFKNRLKNNFKVIFDKKIPFLIKIITAYLSSISWLIIYINDIFFKWTVEPDIGVRNNLVADSDIAEPEISIYSPILLVSGIDNYIEIYMTRDNFTRNLSITEQSYQAAMSHLCGTQILDLVAKVTVGRNDKDVMKLLNKRSPNINDVFKHCFF